MTESLIHPKKPRQPRVWHAEQEKILKEWGEACIGYGFMHHMSYKKFKKESFRFTLPVIIISTITGTANFASESVPAAYRHISSMIVGVLNLTAGVLATVTQFLKVNELTESHRVSSISFYKLARNIQLELALPLIDRTFHGSVMLDICKLEYDRLIEQSPGIPKTIINYYLNNLDSIIKDNQDDLMNKPDILNIRPISILNRTNDAETFVDFDVEIYSDTTQSTPTVALQY